jgi:hypothetical protein
MSTTARIVTWVIAIIVVIALIWAVIGAKNKTPTSVPEQTATTTDTTQSQAPADPLAGTGMTAVSATSDSDLSADQAAIDSQMNGLTNDASAVDLGVNAAQ